MEILTLIKANIRHKRGSFTSIIILMIIVSLSMTSILSIRQNCENSVANAITTAGTPALSFYIITQDLTDDMLETIQSNTNVQKTVTEKTIYFNYYEVNDTTLESALFVRKYDSRYRLLNDDLSGYADSNTSPADGEVYVPQSLLTSLNAKAGDRIRLSENAGQTYTEMTISGVIVDPIFGSSSADTHNIFVNNEYFEKLYSEKTFPIEISLVEIYKRADSPISDAKLKQEINLQTKIIDLSFRSMTSDEAVFFTLQFSDVVTSILIIFLIFLTVIVLIVIRHSIITSVELDYTNFGILKAIGFTKKQIRLTITLQYISAQLIGAIIGFLLAIPLTGVFGNIFQPVTAIPNENGIAVLKSILLILAILAISAFFIALSTNKIGTVSPVKAISGAKSDVYFDSRLNVPISPNALSACLALRQFTSNKKKYFSTIIIAAILVFFMLTITVLGDTFNSKSALESMGIMMTEVNVYFKDDSGLEKIDEIEDLIQEYSPIRRKYYYTADEYNYHGINILCIVYDNEDAFNITSGRAPKYDNEIVITEFVADELSLSVGDTIVLTKDNRKAEYIITGIHQTMYESGHCFGMNFSGAKKLGNYSINCASYSIEENYKAMDIKSALEKKFGEFMFCESQIDPSLLNETYNTAIIALKAFIYTFSVIFSFVVIMMVCRKAFMQEKNDIGIYKALGVKISSLRLQFALRFLISAVIGSVFGTLLSLLISERMLEILIRSFGIARFNAAFTPMTFIVPIALILLCFFVFAYIISGKIKKVDVRELIFE